jgi:hypothetical protein
MNKLVYQLREILIQNFGSDEILKVNGSTIIIENNKIRIVIEYDLEGDVYDVYGNGVISNADYSEVIEEVENIINDIK